MCGDDDEIKAVRPGELSDLCRRNARQQDSRALTHWEFRLEERIEFVASDVLLLFGNLGECSHIELQCVMTVNVEDMNQRHSGPENSRRPLHIGGHGAAGRREVHREQNVLDRPHRFASHSGFHSIIRLVLKTEWLF